MPPIQPSLRGSLLTGASALALSMSASGAQAQSSPNHDVALPTWTVWIEGSPFWTGGGSFNIPSISTTPPPLFGAPYTSLNPRSGLEGAFGFDYRWDPVWHFVFDFRYGKTRTASTSSGNTSTSGPTSSTNVFFTPSQIFGLPRGTLISSVVTTTTNNSSSTHTSEWESHLVTDFMAGRDIGMGANPAEFEFGIRIADLQAAAQESESTNSTTTGSVVQTFYCATHGGVAATCPSQTALTPTTSSTSAFADWSSHFFGVGPRVAITQDVPLVGSWSFDYEAGIAALFGPRSFNANGSSSTGVAFSENLSATVGVFNADGWAALSYWFTPHVRLSGGIRGDFYDAPLVTYNINTGSLQNIDRLYWGPFLRLTSSW
jgi:hypothetical protein